MKSDNHSKRAFVPDMYSPRGEERYFSPLHKQILEDLLQKNKL